MASDTRAADRRRRACSRQIRLERVARVLALLIQTNRSWCVSDSTNLSITARSLLVNDAAEGSR